MDNYTFFIYLIIIAGSTYLIRTIPFVAFTKNIENRFVKSFLYYIPYAVLTVMTIPGIFYGTKYLLSGVMACIVAIIVATRTKSLTIVAVATVITVLLVDELIILI